MVKSCVSISILAAILLTLASCAKVEGKKPFAAKVNGEDISAQQVYDASARGGGVPPGAEGKLAAARVLDRIIDQELLVQKAHEAKLDRDPSVMQAIKSARRQILGQAYLAKAISAVPKVSREEIESFYRLNPALFERRRIYRFVELAVAAPAEQLGALEVVASGTTHLDDVESWLKSQQLPFKVLTSSAPAEQIPMNVLRQVVELRDGQIAVFATPRGASVLQLMHAAEAPVSEQEAMSVIAGYLLNRKRLDIVQVEVRKLRERAKIEYGNGFEPPLVTAPHLTAAAPPALRAQSPAVIARGTRTSLEVVTPRDTQIR
jgi:EpsD family peptidyl-prolyl cis-trans isomerase